MKPILALFAILVGVQAHAAVPYIPSTCTEQVGIAVAAISHDYGYSLRDSQGIRIDLGPTVSFSNVQLISEDSDSYGASASFAEIDGNNNVHGNLVFTVVRGQCFISAISLQSN